jgi:hypothetical protein
VFPDFVSPNNDNKNDRWNPSFLGKIIPDLLAGGCQECPIRKVGMSLLKSITVVNLFNPKIVYINAEGEIEIFNAIFINGFADSGINSLTYCVYTVVFRNGSTKTGFIGVDPTNFTK